MKFSDQGIIISQKKFNENSLIVKVFSQNHGIYNGFVKSAKSQKNRTIFQIGNLVSFEHMSRNEESLGQFANVDLVKGYCSKIMFDRLRLDCANSLFSIIDSAFLERENHEDLFGKTCNFLENLSDDESQKEEVIGEYVKLELEILKNLGYEIDLSSCVVTNSKVNLAFVSPKSAHAVSFEIGQPYKNKLLKLPNFLIGDSKYEENQLIDGLKLSGYFLEKFIFEDKNLTQRKQFSYRENITRTFLKK